MDPSYNSFQSNGVFSQSDANTVVKKKNNKKAIVLVVVLAIVIIVGLFLFWIISQRSSENKTARQLMNEYSYLLLTGEEKNESVPSDSSWGEDYFVNKVLHAQGEYDAEYFGLLVKTYDSFADKFYKEYTKEGFSDEEEYELACSLVENMKTVLKAAKEYASKDILTDEQREKMTTDEIKERFNGFEDSNNYILNGLLEANISLSEALKSNDAKLEAYYRKELSRLERHLGIDTVDMAAWLYKIIDKYGEKNV